MRIVPLASGGLDSTVMMVLARQQGAELFPLFVDYGQKSKERELSALEFLTHEFRLPPPKIIDLSDYGRTISSGLTSSELDTFNDAFLPCRNLIFLTLATAYAYEVAADAIGIGLLHDDSIIFPDQSSRFLDETEKLLRLTTGTSINIIAPLKHMSKADVLLLAKRLGVSGYYSCHEGSNEPCGVCIACREYEGLEV